LVILIFNIGIGNLVLHVLVIVILIW